MEFVIGEMLRLAVHLDYADEIGRRKMFALVRTSYLHCT
jgi:condensin complex subunit 3